MMPMPMPHSPRMRIEAMHIVQLRDLRLRAMPYSRMPTPIDWSRGVESMSDTGRVATPPVTTVILDRITVSFRRAAWSPTNSKRPRVGEEMTR